MANDVLVTAVAGGVTNHLNNVCEFWLEDIDGLGLAAVDRHVVRYPSVDGDIDRGHYVNPRFILLTWVNQSKTRKLFWALRREVNGIFRPRDNSPIVLTFYFPDGFKAAANVNLTGQLDNEQLDPKTQRVVATLKANDPRLYNPDKKTVSFALLENDEGWDIELPGATATWADNTGWDVQKDTIVPLPGGSGWNIGVSVLSVTQVIAYAQNVTFADIEYPVITLLGPIQNPIITNQTTGEKIDLTNNGGLSLAAGERVVIDLATTAKTIVNQDGTAVDQYLTTDSDLATFHLAYNGELLSDGSFCDGNNTLLVQGTGATTATNVLVEYYERFAGVG